MSKTVIAALILGAVASVAAAQTTGPANPLASRRGWEVGGQVSDYRYQEPDVGVKIWGPKIGGTGAYTFTDAKKWSKFDLRLAYGRLKYEGSGTADSEPDLILETRAAVGRDFFPGGGVSLSPYLGLGYRYLFNDLRGTSSTGAIGYRRYSTYVYVPLGLTTRFSAGESWVIAPTVEYDYLIRGTQKSQLTDAGLGFTDATNEQDKGRGYRLSLMVENGFWAFGPWTQYWNIKDSDIVPIGFGRGAQEPRNQTREYGLELKYRF
ncbi:MAG: outer membrane beta-barrel protein [Burkholderiales bacterium]